jgi:hypothetical protein
MGLTRALTDAFHALRLQLSVPGAWDSPLEVAYRAADLLTAQPTAQRLKDSQFCLGTIHIKMLGILLNASNLLVNTSARSPLITRARLQGNDASMH